MHKQKAITKTNCVIHVRRLYLFIYVFLATIEMYADDFCWQPTNKYNKKQQLNIYAEIDLRIGFLQPKIK